MTKNNFLDILAQVLNDNLGQRITLAQAHGLLAHTAQEIDKHFPPAPEVVVPPPVAGSE